MKDQLKQIREKLRKTQKEMGALVGVHERAWQKYEKGSNLPGSEVLQALSKLGFNTNWILTGAGDMYTTTVQNTCESVGQINDVVSPYVTVRSQIPNIQSLMRDLMDIMDSNDEGTKLAIAQNIMMFKESVRRKQQLESKPDPRETDFKTLESPGEKKAGGGNGE
ncbi:XRE family transcriptional regulator [Sulfuricurvum sp. IAE1]|uniref:helix-turn-helix domain-containing protein n=1 Tax=Sulfuricurvum sp. IAE1 TaxID=2546102 RepID=UPI00104C6F65|nr:helix-turn-helix transcriptional regulator [Sulfuricurvum sp. IAE1]TDA63261.1 XRE family transcriptional regulator [Sulfuricurvum sp. IAE1]